MPADRSKRLQVFVSSTYADLKSERQAAVEAILAAGHIPAGMELFAAGDQSQLKVIKRWIDNSDVYMLILGGRYGSIEPTTGKSYTHLEFEYAVEKREEEEKKGKKGKPLFSVVIDEEALDKKVQRHGKKVIETENPQQLKEFRKVVTSNVVRFWKDRKDIKLAILEKMAELIDERDDLVGWIPGDQAVNTAALADQLARLSKANEELREKLRSSSYFGLSYATFCQLIGDDILPAPEGAVSLVSFWPQLVEVSQAFQDEQPSVLHGLWFFRDYLLQRANIPRPGDLGEVLFRLFLKYGFFDRNTEVAGLPVSYKLTEDGRRFLLRLLSETDNPETRRLVFLRID